MSIDRREFLRLMPATAGAAALMLHGRDAKAAAVPASIARGPTGFAFPKDPSKAYVTNHDAGTISVVDLDKLDFVETFASSRKPVSGPETIAFFGAKGGD
jgi:DNA-binding beta-propeller fold protein YncE